MRWCINRNRALCRLTCNNFQLNHHHQLQSLFSALKFITHQHHHYSSLPFFASSSLPQVETLQAKSIKSGSAENLQLMNYILSCYVKASDFNCAEKLFDEMPERDVRSWTILISGFSRRVGFCRKGLDYFVKMVHEGDVLPNEFTLASLFRCCANDGRNGVGLGKAVHGWILRNRFRIVFDVALQNAVLDYYVKCGYLVYAKRLFELMEDKNTVSWNIMMAVNLSTGDVEKSIEFFKRMPRKDTSSWNSLIDGLLKRGFERIALEMLYEMAKVGAEFDKFTFSMSLALASSLRNWELGRQIHGQVLRVGIDEDAFVRSSLIDMYCKCGQMKEASTIFKQIQDYKARRRLSKILFDDLVEENISWSTMIAGYVQNGMINEALECFLSMINEKIELNVYTLTSIIAASASAQMLELGQQIHTNILKSGHEQDVVLSSSAIDMYAKCGRLDEARLLFKQTKTRNVILWTAMISSYAAHGEAEDAIQLFKLMRDEGVSPNEVTFVGVITACCHSGLVQEGCMYYKMMTEVYGIRPGIEHFTSMVDLFGRAGCFDDIKDFINANGISHLVAVWKAFLSSCWLHKNLDMAKWVSKKLLELDSSEASPYILLSNTCSANHIWDEAATLRCLMQEKKVRKLPGQSWT